jgi:ABC-2 type transport system ATP-binding protein
MTEYAVECRGLTRKFGEITAVESLDLTVERNAVFGFLGPNGAGKTTTIKMLTGLLNVTEGDALVVGRSIVSESRNVRALIGYLPEEQRFYEWMSGEQFLRFIGNLFEIPSEICAERITNLLKDAQLEGVRTRKIKTYSRGMKQRLGIAQAFINEPQILFLDEPCSALDPLGRAKVLDTIARIKENTTVFMSSHILADVDRVCDSVAIIDKGRLVTEAPIEELRKTFTQSIIRLTVEKNPSQLEKELQNHEIVTRIVRDGTSLELHVNDIEQAKKEIPQVILTGTYTLTRYEIATPTLEDIFVQLVGQ